MTQEELVEKMSVEEFFYWQAYFDVKKEIIEENNKSLQRRR
ncbi:hypothetical protein [Tepidimicrobium xylanilyticum]